MTRFPTRHLRDCWPAILVVALLAALTVTTPAGGLEIMGRCLVAAAQESCCIRLQDEIWLVSTLAEGRRANPCSCSTPRLCYFQYCCASDCWQLRTAADFFTTQTPDTTTTVFVHGNRQRRRKILQRGLQSYCLFRCCLPSHRRLRHVIWEWPSMPIPCPTAILRDGRVKFRRTPAQAYFLGAWLSQLEPTADVRLVGHSHGCTLITGALHLMAGGRLDCRCLPTAPHGQRVRPRVVLWAAATEGDWLCPCQPHGCAPVAGECFLNVYSLTDPVLRRLGWVFRIPRRCPVLGLDGATCCRDNLHQLNATCDVGRHHNVDYYFQSCRVMNCTRAFLQLQ